MESGRLPENLIAFINEEACKSNYRVVDVTSKGRGTLSIEIVLDKEGGISAKECGDFNRLIVAWIDANGLFNGYYVLDVCSPGLDRELVTINDLKWAEGRGVCVMTREPVDGKTRFIGKLIGPVNEAELVIEDVEGQRTRIERKKVSRAQLHFVK